MNTAFKIILILLLTVGQVWADIDFDGTDDSLSCGTADILQENAALTISAWINPDVAHLGAILGRRKGSSPFGGLFFRTNLATSKAISLLVSGSTPLNRVSAVDTVTTGVWQHVLVTWDGSTTATNIHLYHNGVEVSYAITTNGVTLTDTSGGTTRIGGLQPDSGEILNPFNGKIAIVEYWNVVLNAQEIANLASSKLKRMGLQIRPASLVASWALDEQADGTSADGDTFVNLKSPGTHNCTGSDGGNNTGLTAKASEVLSYP